MKIASVVVLAAALSATGVAALTDRPIPALGDTPVRAYRVLGPVELAAETRPAGAAWQELQSPLLAAQARQRYGRETDAIIHVHHAALPNGSGTHSTALAIAWD